MRVMTPIKCQLLRPSLVVFFEKSVPNRAEVSDLSNLVSEAIDAIMLTSETTVSLNPLSTVETIKK